MRLCYHCWYRSLLILHNYLIRVSYNITITRGITDNIRYNYNRSEINAYIKINVVGGFSDDGDIVGNS